MMQYFGDFGCESPCPRTILPRPCLIPLPGRSINPIDFGGKDIAPSQKVLAKDSSVHTWKAFVEAQDWSKITA